MRAILEISRNVTKMPEPSHIFYRQVSSFKPSQSENERSYRAMVERKIDQLLLSLHLTNRQYEDDVSFLQRHLSQAIDISKHDNRFANILKQLKELYDDDLYRFALQNSATLDKKIIAFIDFPKIPRNALGKFLEEYKFFEYFTPDSISGNYDYFTRSYIASELNCAYNLVAEGKYDLL
ncbi:hypothetical protein OAP83_03195, partial [Rickettsiales bacterium]|nr:hypothetical protein [Rickettsiales bacterium]